MTIITIRTAPRSAANLPLTDGDTIALPRTATEAREFARRMNRFAADDRARKADDDQRRRQQAEALSAEIAKWPAKTPRAGTGPIVRAIEKAAAAERARRPGAQLGVTPLDQLLRKRR